MMSEYIRLLDDINFNEILKVDNGIYRFIYGTDKWTESSIFYDYKWPDSILFGQYETIELDKAEKYIELNNNLYEQWFDLSVQIASLAHHNQKDKGGNPYIEHPIYVSSRFEEYELKIVAMLHDVCEDSEFTCEDLLRLGFPTRLVMAINVLTKSSNESYDSYICKIKSNELARRVKIEDLKHNLDVSRLRDYKEADKQREIKYKNALSYLVG